MATYDEEVIQRAAALRQRAAGASMVPTAPPAPPAAARGASPALAAATPKPAKTPLTSNPALGGGIAAAGQALAEAPRLGAVFSDKAASGMDKGSAVGESAARVGGAGAGAAYGAAKGAALGSALGPWGTLAGGVIGGIGGAALGPKIADTAIGAGRAVTNWAINPSQDAQPAQASYSNEGRNSKQPIMDPAAPAAAAIVADAPEGVNASQTSPQAPAAQPVAGPQRIDKPGASPLFTNLPANDPSNVAMMARGAPSAQNMAAADALSTRYATQAQPATQQQPTVITPKSTGGFGLLSNEARAARELNMQMQRGMGETARAYAARMAALSAAQGAQASREGNQLNAEVARERNTQEAGLGASRMRLDEQRAATDAMQAQDNAATNSVKRSAAQLEMGAAQQAADLQRQYLEAPDEAARAEVAKKISALSGNSAGAAKDNFIVVGGGQEWDQASGLMRNVPQRLIDVRTGQEVGAPAGQKPSAPAQQSFVSGQTYTDAQGNKARWDGEKFVPVK